MRKKRNWSKEYTAQQQVGETFEEARAQTVQRDNKKKNLERSRLMESSADHETRARQPFFSPIHALCRMSSSIVVLQRLVHTFWKRGQFLFSLQTFITAIFDSIL